MAAIEEGNEGSGAIFRPGDASFKQGVALSLALLATNLRALPVLDLDISWRSDRIT